MNNFTIIHSASLLGLFTVVLIKNNSILFGQSYCIREICRREGFLGVLANKGNIELKLLLGMSEIDNINCHLLAGSNIKQAE